MFIYYALLLISATGVAAALVLVRLSEVDPTATLWLRMGGAFLLLLLPIGFNRDTEKKRTVSAANRPSDRMIFGGIVLTGLLFCADLLANHWSVKFTSVANASLLMNLTPIFVVILAYFSLRERQSVSSILGIVLSAAGAMVLVGDSYSLGREQLFGDLLALISALMYGVYIVVTKMIRVWVPATRLLKWHTGLCCLFLTPIVLTSSDQIFPMTLNGWAIIIGLATISQIIGHGLMTFVMKHISAGVSSISTLIIPIISALLAWAFLDEAIQIHHLLGGALVLGGVALYVLHDLRNSKKA